jgi:hypothetical protein
MATILASMLIYFSIKKTGYLLYAIYTFIGLIFYLLVGGFLKFTFHIDFGDNAFLISAMNLSVLIGVASLYGVIFLNIKKYCIVIYYVLVTEICFSLAFTSLIWALPHALVGLILDTNALILLSLGVLASTKVYQKGNTTAIYYLIGYIFYFIGGTLQILTDNYLIASYSFGKHGGEIGVMFEALFLLIGLTQ